MRLGRSRVIKIDVIGKHPPHVIKTSPALGQNSSRLLEDYVEKQSYCHNCFSTNHHRKQCETKRCGFCLSTLHTVNSCTASQAEYECGICMGAHASLKCPQRFAPKSKDQHINHTQQVVNQPSTDSSNHDRVITADSKVKNTKLDVNLQSGNHALTPNTDNSAINNIISGLSSKFEALSHENKELHTQMSAIKTSMSQLANQLSTLVNQ